ncbi:MAG: hypothetical protein ABIY39_10320, partial [Sphingomonas sp.]
MLPIFERFGVANGRSVEHSFKLRQDSGLEKSCDAGTNPVTLTLTQAMALAVAGACEREPGPWQRQNGR